MRKILNISIDSVVPDFSAVLKLQGFPDGIKPDERLLKLIGKAILAYKQKAIPMGIIMEVQKEEFEEIFIGEGRNELGSPVKPIFYKSDDLALFAVTIDEDVCEEITKSFQLNDFVHGSLLDSVASEGTEMAAQELEDYYKQHLTKIGRFNSNNGILRFSPGYCGWHISSQRKLFQYLKPEDIGITLNDSFLMQPIKSISGVIISGKKEIFEFEDTFSFCRDCATNICKERIKSMMA